jgi:hypothetical protein
MKVLDSQKVAIADLDIFYFEYYIAALFYLLVYRDLLSLLAFKLSQNL